MSHVLLLFALPFCDRIYDRRKAVSEILEGLVARVCADLAEQLTRNEAIAGIGD